MTILFDSTQAYKTSTRRRPFGVGLQRPKCEPYTMEDLAFAARELNQGSEFYAVSKTNPNSLDQRAAEAAWYGVYAAWPMTRGGVSKDAQEEAAERFGCKVDAEGFPVLSEQNDYDAYQNQMSKWLAGRGPRPE
ncbi:MAG: hypothetical protein P4L84_11195 [Isosphaeraceae bacterium]|nr:hypothetical protein [Isosphaeraceae bacterium]